MLLPVQLGVARRAGRPLDGWRPTSRPSIASRNRAFANVRSLEILFVIGSLHIGGTELHLTRTALALVKLGWRVSVYSLSGTGPLRQELESGGVSVILPPVERGPGYSSFVMRMLRLAIAASHLFMVMVGRRPAIVHFFLPAAYLTGAPLALLARIPVRIMSRRSLNLYQRGHWLVQSLERWLHKTMTAVLGNSRSVVRELREQEGVSTTRLGLIYNGVDPASFADTGSRPMMRAKLGLGPRTRALVIVANLIPYKGHLDLLEALGLANRHILEDWRLFVVGRDDGIGAQLRTSAKRLQIGDKVVFLGPRNDVPEIMKACDIGLLCSHQEGFSNAVLESMAAGLPAIVTDVGGNAEAVVDGETGLVVPPHAPARLAEAIVRLANDPALCAELGAAARQRVAKHFSFKQCVSHYDGLYRMLATDATVRRLESHVGNRAQAFEQSPADRVLDERNVLWSPNFGRKVA